MTLEQILERHPREPACRLAALNHWIAANPPWAAALLLRAEVLIDFCRYREARCDLRAARRLVSGTNPYLERLHGVCCSARGRWRRAERRYRRAAAREPEIRLELSEVIARQGRFHEAEDALAPLWDDAEWRVDARLAFARLLRQQERAVEARQVLGKLLKIESEIPAAYGLLRDLNLEGGDYTRLAGWRCGDADGNFYDAAVALARFHRLREARQMIAGDHRQAERWAYLLRHADNYSRAARKLQRLATLECTRHWIIAGGAHLHLGRFRPAEHCYRMALTCEGGDFDEAWLNLGLLCRAEGRWPEAVDCLQRSLELDPTVQNARDALHDVRRALAYPLSLN